MSNPRVGVAVFIFHPSTQHAFIIGKRKGSHGAGTYALPGGHLEHGESFSACAAREAMEETGLAIDKIRFLTATNDVMEGEGGAKHYVTIFMGAVMRGEMKEPELLEPNKCEGWYWIRWTSLETANTGKKEKSELFQPMTDLMEQRPGFCPWDVYSKG
ncbi:7,8-dihydro-8-oxoguanine triphosphatase NUDT15 [Aulographum hederae CBS 113979]|uniref:7,8-dihydro-8-oxoguanine triphosphatase NUDT15 n=1 Tax=Aulographum hederae CBS 113979 TaxID=1176131 RepID=A0A6G1HB12_9PEZI|nr:7,8-dihydro-8-oxoguanine triphosphatase NUDT15 [Aulographum hederae CBS 113979]